MSCVNKWSVNHILKIFVSVCSLLCYKNTVFGNAITLASLSLMCGGWLGLLASDEVGGVSFDSRSKLLSVGAVKMCVKQGDITKEKVDAIINSTNERIDMTGGTYSLFNYCSQSPAFIVALSSNITSLQQFTELYNATQNKSLSGYTLCLRKKVHPFIFVITFPTVNQFE